MRRLLIVGDSTLDNGAYVEPGGRDVATHLAGLFGRSVAVDFRALDGAVVRDVIERQLGTAGAKSKDVGRYEACVISVGGNDALGHLPLLSDPQRRTFLETALMLAALQAPFRAAYRALLARTRTLAPRVLVLVVYRGCFAKEPGTPPQIQTATDALLSLFTDVMAEEARRAGADVVDLRTLFDDPALYANAIEPNDAGGRAIAQAIAGWLGH